MKSLLFCSLFFFVSLNLFSQKMKREYNYLIHVQHQSRVVISDNLRNAELVAAKVSSTQTEEYGYAAKFYIALADNYLAVNEPEKAIFAILRQRTLFPEFELEAISKELYNKAIHDAKILQTSADTVWLATTSQKMRNLDETLRHTVLLRNTFKIANLYKADPEIYTFYQRLLKQNPDNLPYCIRQYGFYTALEMTPKHKFKFINRNPNNTLYIPTFESKLEKMKFIRHVKRYCKQTNDLELLNQYKAYQ